MPTSAFTRFEAFSEGLAKKEHNLHADVLKVYLSNTTPNVATHVNKADLAEISAGNGYTAGGEDTQNVVSRTGAVSSVVGVDIVWTASGGAIATFRYAVLYNDTHASDALVGYWDYGSAIAPTAPETFTLDFGASMFTVG